MQLTAAAVTPPAEHAARRPAGAAGAAAADAGVGLTKGGMKHMALMDAISLTVWNAIRSYLPPGTRLTSAYRSPDDQIRFIMRTANRLGFKQEQKSKASESATWKQALDYIRSKGYVVAAPGTSRHQTGIAFDFAGANLENIKAALEKANKDKRIRLDKVIIEQRNNCVHAEITYAIAESNPFIQA